MNHHSNESQNEAHFGSALERLRYQAVAILDQTDPESEARKIVQSILSETIRVSEENTKLREKVKAHESCAREQMKLERKLAERSAELEFLNKELESFSYAVKHELKAPLCHVGGFVKVLSIALDNLSTQEIRRHLETIEDSSRQVVKLMDGLLSCVTASRVTFRDAEVNLNDTVQIVLHDLKPETESRTVVWKIGALPTVTGDPSLLRWALYNLISNAIKFTPKCHIARIEIGSKKMGDEIILFVKDNGVGFDARYSQKLFGIFQRLHRYPEFEGTGIGLACVQRIIARHGGRVWAESFIDQGSVFFFSIPEAAEHQMW